jgi:hypothetical protein
VGFVIPGRAKREPGIHQAASYVAEWIPGLRQEAHPGMTAEIEMPLLFRRGLERPEVAERHVGQRVGQNSEIGRHLRKAR